MDLILLEKVKNLGDLGDTVKVKPGYGRNFLLPQGKALVATENSRKVFEERKAELVKKAGESLNAAKLRAQQIEGATITVRALAAEEGKLYGSIGPHDIARAAAAQKLEIRKSEIDMPNGVLRQVGAYTIKVRLHTEVEADLKVVVEEQKG